MKILVENSAWLNIGNFFFQNTIENILKDIFPNYYISSSDGPIDEIFKVKNFNYKKNIFDLRKYLDFDCYVLSGPILCDGFLNKYEKFIKKIYSEKKSYIILSAYGHDDFRIKKFFEQYPPYAISTRCEKTFQIYKNYSINSYNGICNAFFTPYYVDPPRFNYENYIIKSFYSMPEPDVYFQVKDNQINLDKLILKYKKKFFWKIFRHLNFLNNVNDNIDNYKIIRPQHDISVKYNHINFIKMNSYMSYNINNYFTLYKNADLVISDRVHAIVIGLAFGVTSILCGDFDRSSLFDRIPLKKINNCLIPPNNDFFEKELNSYKIWLNKIFDK